MKTDRISRFIIDQVSLYDIEIKTEILILFLNSSIFIILEKFEIKRNRIAIGPNALKTKITFWSALIVC